MANLITSRKQKLEQRARLRVRARSTGQDIRRLAERREAFFIKRLSQELGGDIGKVIEETEQRFDRERERLDVKIKRQKEELKSFAVRNRRRLDQAIKTYDKQGLIEARKRLYPNQPHLRMKFAQDWEPAVIEPPGVPGIGAEYAVADASYDVELDASGEPFPVPGHHGLCKRLRARAHACAGDHRFGEKAARTEQTLIFRHDPPPSVGDAYFCAVDEVWVPMTVTGLSHSLQSDAVFLTQSLALSGGGVAEVRWSVDIEQDLEGTRQLAFSVVDNGLLHGDYSRGGQWFFGGFGVNSGVLDDGPRAIDIEIADPFRMPVMLQTEDHGGGEVRVKVKLNTYVHAEHRHAEAEIDLNSEGCGVEVHEVMLHVDGYIGR